MAGRPLKEYRPFFVPIFITLEDLTTVSFGDMIVLCPVCHSHLVGSIGYQILKTGRFRKFQCKSRICPALKYLRKGKQFTVQTSGIFQDALANHLTNMLNPLLHGDATQIHLSQQFHRSPALMTYIRHKVETILDQRKDLEQLVLDAPMDDAVSLDEMFLKIEGKSKYIIMATAYGCRKVMGIKVTESRDELMMRAVFDEAERNNGKPFSILTIDAWGGSIKMAKNLDRPITLAIHKHKSPYDKAVIWKIEYEPGKRILHKIGTKTDFFKKRRTREYWYYRVEEDLTKPLLKKRGRPKGRKNGQGKGKYVKKAKEDLRKRGPKGIFDVFDKGKKGYAKIDPGRKSVRLAKGGSTTVGAVLNQVMQLFAKMTIQNNLAENKNSVVEHRVWFSGPKDLLGIERRIRTFLFFLNNPRELLKLRINHRLRGDLVYHELKSGLYGQIFCANYLYQQKMSKMEGTY